MPVAAGIQCFGDVARPAGFPHHKMVLILGNDLNRPFGAFVADDVQELARIGSDVLVLSQIELNDGRAFLVRAFAEEGNELTGGDVMLVGLSGNLFVRIAEGRVVAANALGGHRVHYVPSLSTKARAQERRRVRYLDRPTVPVIDEG